MLGEAKEIQSDHLYSELVTSTSPTVVELVEVVVEVGASSVTGMVLVVVVVGGAGASTTGSTSPVVVDDAAGSALGNVVVSIVDVVTVAGSGGITAATAVSLIAAVIEGMAAGCSGVVNGSGTAAGGGLDPPWTLVSLPTGNSRR